MEPFAYYNPTKLIYGPGKVDEVASEILPYGRRLLLVYGRQHLKKSGVYERLMHQFKATGITVIELDGVQSNPRLALAQQGIDICREAGIDFILAVGGGSCSDTAKAIGMGAKIDYPLWDLYEDFHHQMHGGAYRAYPHLAKDTIPMGVVMTKGATGSDFDYTTVLSNAVTKEKLMVINKIMYPKFAVHDPELTYTLDKQELAFGTADIMTHYMEQYFTLSTDTIILDGLKEAGLRTVVEAGRRVQQNPKDCAAQSYLLYCAAWACSDQTMSGAMGGWAAHMIEHELTAATDINHGWGMAIVFPAWMRYVLELIPEKFAQFGERVWGLDTNGRSAVDVGREAIEKTAEYWRSLGLPLTLSEARVDPALIPGMAKQAVRFGSLFSIKALEEADVRAILEMTC